MIIEWVSDTSIIDGVNLKALAAQGTVVNKIASSGSQVSPATPPSGRPASRPWRRSLLLHGWPQHPDHQRHAKRLRSGCTDPPWPRSDGADGRGCLAGNAAQNQRPGNVISMLSYAVEGARRAVHNKWAFLDTQAAFGDAGNPNEYGSAGVVHLFNADLLHPEPGTGGRLMSKEIIRTIAPLLS